MSKKDSDSKGSNKKAKSQKLKLALAAGKARHKAAPRPAPRPKLKKSHKLILRPLTLHDYNDIKEIMDVVYVSLGGAWSLEQVHSQLKLFPEGQLCIEDEGKVIAAALSLVVDYARFGDEHTYDDITGHGYITTHDPKGDTLYGVDIFVHPDYRDLRLGRRLYDARKELCERLNLRAIVAGGRIPNYDDYADEMTPGEYIQLVRNKEIRDPVLSFQLANDFHVRRIIRGYAPQDVETRGYATLLEWINIHYEPQDAGRPRVGSQKQVVRVGAVQWQMRSVDHFDELVAQLEYFVDTVAGYKADFLVLPEFFNAPLLAHFNQQDPPQAMRGLADYSIRLRDAMLRLAVSYNINIVAGSMPEYQDLELRNVSYLIRRDGTYDSQYKLHVTPDEIAYWGMQGGDTIHAIETDIGRVGILICYDVEFPELARILAEQEIRILFVPYWTDTKSSYLRVRSCAQARSIENECYTVITGSVGNLPSVENMDIQYSQSAIFTPADFAFPHDAIAAQATPNTEMLLMADLDLSLLRDLHEKGSVRNLKDRRTDIYSLKLLDRPEH